MYDDRSSDAMEPLCFAILKSLTPATHDVSFYDERLESIPYDEPTDLVAMTVETYTARRAYQVADRYRRQGRTVVMGGYHPTFLPEEALQHADAVVKGDAEGVWEPTLAVRNTKVFVESGNYLAPHEALEAERMVQRQPGKALSGAAAVLHRSCCVAQRRRAPLPETLFGSGRHPGAKLR